ncbi:MAG: autotransporter assembly complex protein TamA [Candidatus Thiodiazotropha sp.]|jgi:translocation and assembly module TamA
MPRFPLILILLFGVQGAWALNLRVDVTGLDSELKENVLAFLSVEQEKSRASLSEARLRLLHGRAESEIRKALQPFGYFKPVIQGSLSKDDEGYRVRYRVEPGPPIELAEVDFQVMGEGADNPRVGADFPLKKGDILNQGVYEAAKQRMLSNTLEQGYLDARYVQHRVDVDLKNYRAAITLYLDTGMRFRFGPVQFHQDTMDPAFLAKYVTFHPGDPFRQETLLNLQAQLIDSEYFKRVEVFSRREGVEGDQVPIDIKLEPNKRNRYRIGLGYSTDTGPRIKLDWKDRRIGREGHRMRTEFLLAKPESKLTSEYIIPLDRPTVDTLRFGASINHFNTSTQQGSKALLNATQSISLDRGWRRSIGVEYLYEDFKLSDQVDKARLLYPFIDWLRIKSDNKPRVRKGKRVNFRLEGASSTIVSSTSYATAYASGRFIDDLGESDWRLLSRLELGVTWTQDLLQLPPSKRFFTGGDNSVRGFSYESLGPRDASDNVIGGRYLAVGGLELDHPIEGKWSGAVFIDAGNSFDPDYDSSTAYGLGLGLRWSSPVGPIRIDLARGRVEDDRHWRLHLVVGPEL